MPYAPNGADKGDCRGGLLAQFFSEGIVSGFLLTFAWLDFESKRKIPTDAIAVGIFLLKQDA